MSNPKSSDGADVFSGLSACDPEHIRRELGALEPSDDEVIPKLIGAVMSLARRVAEQAAELERLRGAR